jgi:ankyrin repeat protein
MAVSRETPAEEKAPENINLKKIYESQIKILDTAIRYGKGDVVSELLKHQDQVNLPDKFNRTLLHYSAWYGEIIFAAELLKQPDVLVNVQDCDGKTPLHLAAHHVSTDVVSALLQRKNIEVNLQDKEGRTPLHAAVITGNVAVVTELLKHPQIQVNVYDTAGKTPLHYAAESGRKNIVAELLKHRDIQVNLEDKKTELTALAIAGYFGFGNVAGELIKHKDTQANLNRKYDFAAVHSANTHGYTTDVNKFLKLYIENYYNRREKDGPYPHWYSSIFGVPREEKLAAARFLLKNVDNPREIENFDDFMPHKKALADGELGNAYKLLKY